MGTRVLRECHIDRMHAIQGWPAHWLSPPTAQMVLGECGGGEGEGGGGDGGGGEGSASHAGICVALPPKRKLRPLFKQQATLYVICAQYSCGRSVAARVRVGCGGTGCEG